MEIKPVNNWQKCWKWFSFQADAIPLAAYGAWAAMPVEWQIYIPEDWLIKGAITFFILGMIGRIIKQ